MANHDAPAERADGPEALKAAGSGRRAPPPVAALYEEAFRLHGTAALWSRRPSPRPTLAQALVVADALRREGDLRARALAERIEEACRAAL